MTRWFSTTTRMSKGRGVLRLRYQRWRIDALSISTDNNSTDRTIQNFSNWGVRREKWKFGTSTLRANIWESIRSMRDRFSMPKNGYLICVDNCLGSSRIFIITYNKLIRRISYIYFNSFLNFKDTLVFLHI